MKKIRIAQSVILITFMTIFSSVSYAALAHDQLLHFDGNYSFWGFDTDNDMSIDAGERVFISSAGGLQLGDTQPTGGIDNQWLFLSNIGFHLTLSDANVLSYAGGVAAVDFDGWTMDWNSVQIPLNGNNGIAIVSCSNTCEQGDEYSLFYTTLTANDAPIFAGVRYCLELHSSSTNYNLASSLSCQNISTQNVPVPASIWLFSSGLIGITTVARRKRGNQ